MRRYIDFRADDWVDRTDSHMQAARWAACVEGLGDDPPLAGVIDAYPDDLLQELVLEGWADIAAGSLSGNALRDEARQAVTRTLADDVDCLSPHEHTLIERMLIGDGHVALETLEEIEAAYTLRMRLWCDIGIEGDEAIARLDAVLMESLPALLMRPAHLERRGRVFIFDGMLNGLLYITGYLDDRMPKTKFIQEVLGAEETPETLRLARNYIEASFDTYALAGCNLLIHGALADPEALAATLAEQGAFQLPELSGGQMAASMNGLLPEEMAPDEKLQRALYGALRPEYEPSDASSDLRFLAKQGAPLDTLHEIMASMLVVLPTQHMDTALVEMRHRTPRWISKGAMNPPSRGLDSTQGFLH